MEQLDARQTLQCLVRGVDPTSGTELPAGTVLSHAAVICALLAGIAALESEAARTRRRAQLPPNLGRPWSSAEEQTLAQEFQAGTALATIAANHHRTLAGIEARLERLGLLSPQQRVTRNRYVSATQPRQGKPAAPA